MDTLYCTTAAAGGQGRKRRDRLLGVRQAVGRHQGRGRGKFSF